MPHFPDEDPELTKWRTFIKTHVLYLQAIYENMLVELPFASFFLSKILSRHSGDLDIHHLASLDPEVYKNLLFLKHYDGDITDLGLDFTAVNSDFGDTKVSLIIWNSNTTNSACT